MLTPGCNLSQETEAAGSRLGCTRSCLKTTTWLCFVKECVCTHEHNPSFLMTSTSSPLHIDLCPPKSSLKGRDHSQFGIPSSYHLPCLLWVLVKCWVTTQKRSSSSGSFKVLHKPDWFYFLPVGLYRSDCFLLHVMLIWLLFKPLSQLGLTSISKEAVWTSSLRSDSPSLHKSHSSIHPPTDYSLQRNLSRLHILAIIL